MINEENYKILRVSYTNNNKLLYPYYFTPALVSLYKRDDIYIHPI